jgi:hypothetical protein
VSKFGDYVVFTDAQLRSTDIDPVYPVLREIGSDYERDDAIWLTFLHVAYYHIGSALAAFHRFVEGDTNIEATLRLPCGTERRAHRDPRALHKHLISLAAIADQHGSLSAWLDTAIVASPTRSWTRIQQLLQQPWGNGRWASYKTGEMLMKVNGLPLEPTDMGHRNGSGSRHGLALLYDNVPTGNTDREIAYLDKISSELVAQLRKSGVMATLETAETSLCDYHSLCEGRYYVGYDIDAMLQQLDAVPSPLTERAFAARKKHIPNEYLGELNGWRTIDKQRARQYRDSNRLLMR